MNNKLMSSKNSELFYFNKVLVNTYLFLSFTIFFSTLTCFLSVKFNAKPINFISMLLIYFGLLFLLDSFKNSYAGIFLLFVFTGFIGFYTGPFINKILSIRNGHNIIIFSSLLTGLSFCILSLYVTFSKKRFDFLNNFLLIGFFVILFSIIFNFFYHLKLFDLLICGFVIIFSSCMILFNISSLINNGNENYIDITISLYLSVYNMFISILQIFNIFSNND